MRKVGMKELIIRVAKKRGITRGLAHHVIHDFIDIIKDEINDGNEVGIKNLVTFKQSVWQEREVVVPSTGKTVMIPERHMVRAKISKLINK